MITERPPRASLRAVAARVVEPRWRLAMLAVHAGRYVAGTLVFLNVLIGLAPVGFVLASSTLAGRIPVVTGGVGSPAWRTLIGAFLVAGAANLLQQLLTPVRTALDELLIRRVDGHVFDRLIGAALLNPGIAPLEDQQALNLLADARRDLEDAANTPGRGCAGLLALIARYTQLLSLAVAIGVSFSWLAALSVFATTITFRYGQRGGLRKFHTLLPPVAGPRRKADYLRDVVIGGGAAKEIRVFRLAEWLIDRYRADSIGWMRPLWFARRRIYLKPFLLFSAVGVGLVGGVLVAVGAAAAQTLSLTATALVLQAVLAAVRLGDNYPESDMPTAAGITAYDAVGAFEAVAADASSPEPHPNTPLAAAPADFRELRFARVGFRYPGSTRAVVDDLTLTIAAGRSTAVVGVNGAGKTTLVKLLTRLYEPTWGAIEADGVDIRRFPVEQWRQRVAVVFQDFLRYEASIADNIAFGAVEHLDDREGVRRAAEAAGLAEVIDRLPNGLDTPLTRQLAGGVDLSGGQWQRVAIARAMFAVAHGASMLVMDEPTASLDIRAEARFFREILQLTTGVTTVLISHRFSTVRQADHIVVLNDGRVAEQGPHDTLVAAGGRYATLFRLQARRFLTADVPRRHREDGMREDRHA